jgi:RHS repeat-associated protein
MGTWNYTYDGFNRLTSASATAGVDAGLTLGWTYDRYGNRWAQNVTGSGNATAVQGQMTFYGTSGVVNNRIDGWLYDAAGNLLFDNINHYTYDAENRIATLNGAAAYIYDAEGRRVAKLGSSGTVTAKYVLGLGGEQLSEINAAGAWAHSNVFVGGKILATYEGPGGTAAAGYHFHLTDWLGTMRIQTNALGQEEERCYSYPFGDGLTCTGAAADATEHHFTGKERDAESGLDYFGARYLNSNLGRWISPDSLNLTDDRVFNPANTLNKYAYGANNPLTYTDPDGKDITVFYESPQLTGSFPFFSVGHMMFQAVDQRSGDTATMSFGPVVDSEYGFTVYGGGVNSTKTFDSNMTANELRQTFSALTFKTTPEEAQKVIEFIRQLSTSVTPYALYSTNCTTVCREALKIIGYLNQNNKNWTPISLWTSIFAQYANENWKNGFGYTASAPGIDYGRAPGYDEWVALANTLAQPVEDDSSVKTEQGPGTACCIP